MANANVPFGLRPVRYADGRPYNGACNPYWATGATGVIAIGDPVIINGTSNTAQVEVGDGVYAPGMLSGCQIALDGDGDPITGVCVGVVPVTRDSTTYRATSTDRIILVADAPDLIFQVQQDAGGTIATTDVGLHCCLKVGTASTVTGQSAWVIDASDAPANDPSNQLILMNLSRIPGNEVGNYAIWDVMINNHQLANVDDAGRMTAV